MVPSPFLDIKGLSVEFRTRNGVVRAIENVNLELAKGEVLGIVGESGSGKSVTAYTVIGLLDDAGAPAAGSATFDGISVTDADESTLRDLRGREISMIFQNPRAALNPIRRVGQQIEDVLLCHGRATRQTARIKAIEMLEKVKIVEPEMRYSSYPFELSGGMCQRVMIAIALACDPRLLIADEPTTGLDVTTQKATMDLVRDLTQERNMAVVLITHDLGMAAAYCDRIVVSGRRAWWLNRTGRGTVFQSTAHLARKNQLQVPQDRIRPAELAPGNTLPTGATVPPGPSAKLPGAWGGENIPEVFNLVKEFPIQQTAGRHWPWRKASQPDRSFRAVDDISFSLKRGESLGLVGESGCGKSTTSSIITRLMDPTSGDIIFDGRNITAFRSQTFAQRPERKEIQMVFQDPTDSLNPRYSAYDSIAEPLKRLTGLRDRGLIRENVEALAERVGLPEALLSRFRTSFPGTKKPASG